MVHGSGIVSSTDNMLGMSVVRGVRGVDGVEVCMSLTRGGVEGQMYIEDIVQWTK